MYTAVLIKVVAVVYCSSFTLQYPYKKVIKFNDPSYSLIFEIR